MNLCTTFTPALSSDLTYIAVASPALLDALLCVTRSFLSCCKCFGNKEKAQQTVGAVTSEQLLLAMPSLSRATSATLSQGPVSHSALLWVQQLL